MRDHIISEIKRLAAETGKPPGVRAFSKETGIGQGEWYGVIWAKWGDALKEAGLSTNSLQTRFDSDGLLRRLAEVSRGLGYVPTTPEMKIIRRSDDSFPNPKTIAAHFGDRDQVIEAIRSFCRSNDGFEGLLLQLPAATKPFEAANKRVFVKEGWVYLLKSGSHFKIGRSDQIERRLKEISISLPDATVLLHAIRTDDPPGIEAYWHKRFADHRANGEWFKLDRDQVAAFKRRTFQ